MIKKYNITKWLYKRRMFLFLLLSLFLHFNWVNGFAQEIAGTEKLINNAKQYNNQQIIFHGEVIGEVMLRGSHAWVNLFDGYSTIGVWIPQQAVSLINYRGRYGVIGDWLQVKGIFHRNCLEHGGDLDIHAEEIQIIQPGRINSEARDREKEFWAKILAMVALCVFILHLHKEKKSHCKLSTRGE